MNAVTKLRSMGTALLLLGSVWSLAGCAVDVADDTEDVELYDTVVVWTPGAVDTEQPETEQAEEVTTLAASVAQQQAAKLGAEQDSMDAAFALAADQGNDGDNGRGENEDNPDPTPWVLNPDPTPWEPDHETNEQSDPDPQPWRD